MKTGKSIEQLAAELTRQQESKQDYMATTNALRLTDDLKLEIGGGDNIRPITKIAQRQIGNRVDIPAKYFDRMAEAAPELLATNVNHWFENQPEKRFVRTLDGNVRAFLSERYRALDNFELAEAVLPKLIDSKAKIESCEVTERRMYIKAVIEDMEAEIPPAGVTDWQWGQDHHAIDVVQGGIVISNSEVGSGALSIQPAIQTVKCSNLAVFRNDAMSKYHIGRAQGGDEAVYEFLSDRTKELTDAAVWAQVRDFVDAAMDGNIFNKIVDRLKTARGMTIEADPIKVIEAVKTKFALSEDERGGVLHHLIGGGELTAYGVHSAITRYSQDVDDYDRASELERAGAQVIELKPTDWQAIAEAA